MVQHLDLTSAASVVLGTPTEAVVVNSLSASANNGKVKSIALLGSPERILWTQKEEYLQIHFPKSIQQKVL